MALVPTIKLNNGVRMPAFGMGTLETVFGDLKDDIGQAVKDAIDIGYRLFDCAYAYKNEQLIGQAVQDYIKQGKIKRDDIFIVTKLWMQHHRPELVETAVRESLKKLQLDQLDLFLVHSPMSMQETGDPFAADPETRKTLYGDVDYVDTWKALEGVYKKGLVRAIGISNFNSKQIARLLEVASVVPAVNQVELHPFFNQEKLRKFCKGNGIEIMSYSPLVWLAKPKSTMGNPGDPDVPKDEEIAGIAKIAKRYGKSVAQIALKWNVQLGNIVIPKSFNKDRMKENLDIFDFDLAPEDMSYINKFNTKFRVLPLKGWEDHPHFPFAEEF